MQLEEIRDLLLQNMDAQKQTDEYALSQANKLNQQKLMYSNEARGTLYSGQPTWERAQLASQYASDLADINNNYMKNKLSVWENITSVLDQIETYNKAAKAMAQATQNVTSSDAAQRYLDLYNSLNGGS